MLDDRLVGVLQLNYVSGRRLTGWGERLTAINLSALHSREVILDMYVNRSETLSQAVILPSFILSIAIATRNKACWSATYHRSYTYRNTS
jgi:hypothetical protein